MNIQNRRYTGSKYKLMPWIKEIIIKNCKERDSLFDVFGGTGVVTDYLYDDFNSFVINDFLYSNNIIYRAFFGNEKYDYNIICKCCDEFNDIDANTIEDNYVSLNYGNKYFEFSDSKKIGEIRERIEQYYKNNEINTREYAILLASLLYSLDRISNTCGHYEAYIKKGNLKPSFKYELIEIKNIIKPIQIFREDSNELVKRISASVAYIDPPYNSRQYSRFYHVLEMITKWEKPELYGVAMKPKPENMSDYCSNSAPKAFDNLISNLNVKYIVVSYNNTYDSKSSSSRNKITLEEIENSLNKRGITQKFTKKYNAFNAGKTDMSNHQEIVFVTEVKNNE